MSESRKGKSWRALRKDLETASGTSVFIGNYIQGVQELTAGKVVYHIMDREGMLEGIILVRQEPREVKLQRRGLQSNKMCPPMRWPWIWPAPGHQLPSILPKGGACVDMCYSGTDVSSRQCLSPCMVNTNCTHI